MAASSGDGGSGGGGLEVYNMYIFDRRGSCLYYHEWARPHNPLAHSPDEDARLVFGLLFSLKQLGLKLAPGDAAVTAAAEAAGHPGAEAALLGRPGNLSSFSTANSTLHQFETASGLRFVLNTSRCREHMLRDVQNSLRHVYAEIYVDVVVKNPAFQPGAKISSARFNKQLHAYIVGMAGRLSS